MKPWLVLALLLAAGAAGAQTTYRWIDKEGKVHYSGLPPAPSEAKKVEKRQSSLLGTDADPTASYTLRQAVADYPVTLYTQPDCEPCKIAKDHLTRRGIPFTEKSLATEADLVPVQALFAEGQKITIPVMQVGRKAVKAFLASEWDSLLDAAGYPKAPAKAPAPAAAAPAAGR